MTDAVDVSVRAIHLAAGEGTRLRPITDDRPKPLVELGGRTLLERNVETLLEAGVTDQLVVTGYHADRIRDLGYETVHNPVYDETDMVYSLFRAREEGAFPETRDLLISYGDIVYDRRVVDVLLESVAEVAVVVDNDWLPLWKARFTDPLEDAETLRIEGNRIVEIGAAPDGYEEIEAQYLGLIKVRSDFIERFGQTYDGLSGADDGARSSIEMTQFLQRLVDDGHDVEAVPIERGWLEVDTTEDLSIYREWVASGQIDEYVDL